PIEGQVASVDHLDQCVQHLAFLPHLIAEAEMLFAFDQAQCLNGCRLGCHSISHIADSARALPAGYFFSINCRISEKYANPQNRSISTRYCFAASGPLGSLRPLA